METELKTTIKEIDTLLLNDYAWEEIGYLKPTKKDIERSKVIYTLFHTVIEQAGYTIKKPYVSSYEEGGASLAWYSDNKTLYLEINKDHTIATKLWDDDDKTYVTDEYIETKDFVNVWEWYLDNE